MRDAGSQYFLLFETGCSDFHTQTWLGQGDMITLESSVYVKKEQRVKSRLNICQQDCTGTVLGAAAMRTVVGSKIGEVGRKRKIIRYLFEFGLKPM